MSSSDRVSEKECHSYRLLKTHFTAGGFNYRQIARENDAAIYEQTRVGIENPSVGYEVVRIRRHKGTLLRGKWLEPWEVYPAPSTWGDQAWTFTDKERAFAKLREITTKESKT